ncbi:hypothetical protein ABW20_dc0103872 [Dactylellina cionopaga]|nr:hypothetical protein ABW20_dc0103872 [Dactylellina cionopaga]
MAIATLEIDRVMRIIFPHINRHFSKPPTISEQGYFQRPFKLAVTGLQGSGKSTWSSQIVDAINKTGLTAKTLSLDDLYLPHGGLVAIREAYPENKLLQTRGQPGTHDLGLAKAFFAQFEEPTSKEKLFPIFDKSKFGGEGDRLPRSEWHCSAPSEVVDVLVFEGWCVGFQELSDSALRESWDVARNAKALLLDSDTIFPVRTVAEHSLEDLVFINQNLGKYCDVFMGPHYWDFLVHLDTDDLKNVYAWRLEQEVALRSLKGTGMTDEAVVQFSRFS